MTKIMARFIREEKNSTEDLNQTFAETLLDITDGCRASMHEPDEQDLTLEITGDDFDNAGFDSEYHVKLMRERGKINLSTFNLATLIAFARLGAEAYLEKRDLL